MIVCADEERTRHHRGVWFGFGPIASAETVAFAIFETTERDGDELISESFEMKQLVRDQHSLARVACTTETTFLEEVAQRGAATKGALQGVTVASVRELRDMRADVDRGHGRSTKIRSVCVTDNVKPGDFDGHATLGFSEETKTGISEGLRKNLKLRIMEDLSHTFSKIMPAGNTGWVTEELCAKRRLLCLLRVLAAEKAK